MSIRDRFIAALTARGETRVDYPSDKYVAFTRAQGGHFFVGKSGALRFGPTISGSMPVSARAKLDLLGKPEATMGARKAAALSKVQSND